MRRLKHGLGAKLVVAFVAIVAAIGIIGGISYASNNQPFLGDCIEYGIVCNYLNQTSDMETNFATGKYQGNGHTNGNTVDSDKANASGEIRIGEVVGDTNFRGNPLVVIHEDVKKEVKAMLASVSNYAESVVDKKDITAPAEVRDGNNYVLDITEEKDDLVYVDANPMIDNLTAGKIQNGGLKLVVRADQTIVLNTTVKSKITVPRYTVKVEDGKKTHEEMAESVIWNMPYVNNLEISSDNLRATLIAPKAFVNLNVTGEGWLVCDTIVSNSGEWHMISKKVPDITPTPKETATPKPTATPTVKPTPTLTEKPDITMTPETTPTMTPEPTPSDVPVVTPTNTPDIEETPVPSATATTTPPLVNIDENTPLSSKKLTDAKTAKASAKSTKSKRTTTLLDDDVPLYDSAPETGDCFDLITIILVMVVCLIFIILVIKLNSK